MNLSARNALDVLIAHTAEVIKPIVEHIEATSPPTTKDHYGDYLRIIPDVAERIRPGSKESQSPEMKQKLELFAGIALQRAGANRNGVMAALRILGHIHI